MRPRVAKRNGPRKGFPRATTSPGARPCPALAQSAAAVDRWGMPITAYLAGPDVFLLDAPAHAARKSAICAAHGITALPPLNEDIESLAAMPEERAWRTIFAKDVELMERADIVIANLTPFRGASADSGTLIEVGWFLGRGRPVFGYSNTATLFDARSAAQVAAVPDPMPGLSVAGFGLPDNLMIPGAVEAGGGMPILLPEDGRDLPFDSLAVFARCVALVAARVGVAPFSAPGATPSSPSRAGPAASS